MFTTLRMLVELKHTDEAYSAEIERINALESLPAGKDFIRSRDVGLPMASISVKIPNITKKLLKQHPPEEVELSEIYTGQGYVLRSKLINLIHDGEIRDPLTCLEYDGKLFLTDGNHRLAALKVFGKKTALAHVIPIR